jgi:hypothetical protein
LTHLRRLEVKACLYGSFRYLTDAQLFGAYRDLIERGGGDDPLSAFPEAESEKWLAHSALALAACRTPDAFMALEY